MARQEGDEVIFEVKLVPRASREEILGWDDGGRLRIRVASPPVDGAANEALLSFVAKTFRHPSRDVRLVRGQTSRSKTLALRGVSLEEFLASIPPATARSLTPREAS